MIPAVTVDTVVSTPSNKHHTSLGNLAVDLEFIDSFLGSCHIFAISSLIDQCSTVRVLGSDLIVGVDDIGRVDGEEILVCWGNAPFPFEKPNPTSAWGAIFIESIEVGDGE